MLKRIGGILFLLITTNLVCAALVDSLGVKTVKGKKYIEHRVAEHEGWYGIARKYGIPYSDIRVANKEVGDTIHSGQAILVPMDIGKATDPRNLKNYIHKTDSVVSIQKKPLYHKVKQKETLYSIAKKYKVSSESIKKWNPLMAGKLAAGDSIVVGYKIGKKNQGQVQTKPLAEKKAVDKKSNAKEVSLEKNESKEKELKAEPAPVGVNKNAIKKEVVDTTATAIKPDFASNRKEMIEQGVATWIDDENINPNKYFALHRIAPTGTIVKLTNRMNKRTVFVKVVGKLPDTGENENIIIKVSKASAEKLGVRDQRFQCDLSYGVTEK